MPKGKVSEIVSSDTIAKILAAVKTINDLLPFLVALSNDERKSMLKLGPKSLKFVRDVRDMAVANPGIVLGAHDLPEFVKDVDVLEAFGKFAPQVMKLAEGIGDTQMVAGSEAMTTSLLNYGSFKSARKIVSGLDGSLGELGARFKRGPRAKKA